MYLNKLTLISLNRYTFQPINSMLSFTCSPIRQFCPNKSNRLSIEMSLSLLRDVDTKLCVYKNRKNSDKTRVKRPSHAGCRNLNDFVISRTTTADAKRQIRKDVALRFGIPLTDILSGLRL